MKDQGSVPGSRRSPGERNGKPLQYSCLENSVDRRNTISIFRLEHHSHEDGEHKKKAVSVNKLGNDQEFSFGHTIFDSHLSNPKWDIK